MRFKRLIASLLVCVTVLAMALPVGAASSFSDVSDPVTGVNADVLRLMGVVSGSGGNKFSPNSNLTRAEFCVMAVKVMGRGDEVPLHTTRTIFSDVTARHWARGYINLAASIPVNGNGAQAGSRLISGVGNGRFNPDSPITYAQAVTILLRMMGYTDEQAGSVWPAGYLNLAQALGLTQNLTAAPHSPITRAQAAQLFVSLLSTKTQSGGSYGSTLGSTRENVLLLAVNVTGDDGLPGAIRTSAGTFHPAVDGVVPTALQGRRGTLLLNDRSEIITFIPDNSLSVTVTLSGAPQAVYLKSTDGTRYTISPATPAYTASSEDFSTTWGDLWVDVHSGSQITLFLEGGKVIGVYYASGGLSASEAYVVTGKLNAASFHQLTGGRTDYTIKKNNQPINLSDVQQYDVATYDPVSNTVVVSDLRMTFTYEQAAPNPVTPTTITVLGHDFPVLECALDSISQFKIGDAAVLLLTADGKVAAMEKPSAKNRTTTTGLAESDGVLVDLPNGGTIKLYAPVPAEYQNRVVRISAAEKGRANITKLTSLSIPGDFDLNTMTLGSYQVAAGVRIYEETGNKSSGYTFVAIPVNLADIEAETISAENIIAYQTNSSQMVDTLVVKDLTGDLYEYGRIKVDSTFYTDPETGDTDVTYHQSMVNSSGSYEFPNKKVYNDNTDGDHVGIVLDQAGNLRAYIDLKAISGVRRSDFFQQDGLWYVSAGGTVYRVSDEVECYRQFALEWFTQQEDPLQAIRAYSNDMTVYLDPIGGKVRIISCK